MSEDLTAWFHCGRCAALYRAQAGDHVERRCSSCGGDPVLGLEAEVPSGAAVKTGRDPMLRVKMAEVEKPAVFKREVRHHKGGRFVTKLIIVWAVLMGLLALCAKLFWKDEPQQVERGGGAAVSVSDRDDLFLEKAYPECARALAGFISAGAPEEKTQFVLKPVDTAGRMARFYQSNPINSIDPMSVRGVSNGVITLENGVRVIETRWTVSDGRTIDAVFAREKGEWRLDWEDYVRYSDEPWAFFLAGSGDAEGDFRLFARQREGDEKNPGRNLRIHLHAPVFGRPGEAGEVSQEFVLDQLSPEGQMLLDAFKKRAAGERVHASKLETLDPGNMIRVRVRISRKDGVNGRDFKLTKLEACHWLTLPGTDR